MPHSPRRGRRSVRVAGIAASAALAGSLLVGGGLVVGSAPAAAVLGECPPGTIPGPGPSNPVWTDNNVSIYAGGDFEMILASAEAEGLVVVAGDALFDKSPGGRANVGWVGVGSAVVPSPGSTMLAVGGGVAVGATTVLDVGANAFDDGGALLGGNVDVGGITNPDYETDGTRYELNNGSLTQAMGGAAIATWADWSPQIADQSAAFDALPPTGTTTVSPLRVTFTGDGVADPQVFDVDASVLSARPEVAFSGLADDVPVIVNVTGGPVTWAPNYFENDGVRADDFASPLFGLVSARTLWNFADATSVHIAGSSQVLGTILVPGANPAPDEPTLRVTASTNGRLLSGGTITLDGTGNEHHNYPWISAPYECIPDDPDPTPGTLSITKLLDAEDAALLPENETFAGLLTCTVDGEPGEILEEWEVAPGETTLIEDLPVGAECLIEEHLGAGARQRALPPTRPLELTRAFAWLPPEWTIDGVSVDPPVTVVVPPATSPDVAITVSNAVARGAFLIRKDVTGDAAPVVAFDGTWTCTMAGVGTVASGTWSLLAGETSEAFDAPVGAVCNLSETAPADPPDGEWEAPVISPASVVISLGSAAEPLLITVANTFVEEQETGGFDIVKVVRNPAGIEFEGVFTGTWSCEEAGTPVAAGTWTASSGTVTSIDGILLGAECVVREDAPTSDPEGGVWRTAEIDPGEFTVVGGDARVIVTITNILDPTGVMPNTGGRPPWSVLALGAGLILAGIAVRTVVARRTRP